MRRVARGDAPALDIKALKIEPELFQIVFPQNENQSMLKKHARAAYLSRAYMPITVLTWLARKPAGQASA